MQATVAIWQDGAMVPWSNTTVHAMSHTLHYGGGALEGIRAYSTVKGSAIFRLTEHVDRLFYSASVLKMVLPYSKQEIKDAIIHLVTANNVDDVYIRPLIFYGDETLSINPAGNPIKCMIACWPAKDYYSDECIDIKVSSYMRLHPKSTVIDAKLCAHYLNGILATLELRGTHYHDALYLDYHGNISEGLGANFFMVKDGVIYTPKLGGILAGITRDTVIHLSKKIGFDVIEADLSLDQAYQADEAFFTGTSVEVTGIRSLNDKLIQQGQLGPVTKLLKKTYKQTVRGENPDFIDYLTYVRETNVDKLTSVLSTTT